MAAEEVVGYLISLGLARYATAFIEHGFDDMECLLPMEEKHMQQLGMMMGHIVKLSARLAQRRDAPADGAPLRQIHTSTVQPAAVVSANAQPYDEGRVGREAVGECEDASASVADAEDDHAAVQDDSSSDGLNNANDPDIFVPLEHMAKRRRLEEPDESRQFLRLRDNAEDLPAENPAAFKIHPLREEQRRCLAWIRAREARRSGFRGGLLADKMGFGKTATMIGLIADDVATVADGRGCAVRRGLTKLESDFPCKSTLISCPPHLVQQWENEFLKFLGVTGVEILKPTPMPLTKDFMICSIGLPAWIGGVRGLVLNYGEVIKTTGDMQMLFTLGDMIERITIEFPPGFSTVTSTRNCFTGAVVWRENHSEELSCTNLIDVFLKRGIINERMNGAASWTPHPASKVFAHVKKERTPSSRTAVVQGSGPLKILSIATGKEHRRLQLCDLLDDKFDVLIVSTQVYKGHPYQSSINELLRSYARATQVSVPSQMA